MTQISQDIVTVLARYYNLTEQHLYIELYCQKSTKNVCVLLRSKLNGDAQQYTTNFFFLTKWTKTNTKSHFNGRINSI